jgi:hypothetical protein
MLRQHCALRCAAMHDIQPRCVENGHRQQRDGHRLMQQCEGDRHLVK